MNFFTKLFRCFIAVQQTESDLNATVHQGSIPASVAATTSTTDLSGNNVPAAEATSPQNSVDNDSVFSTVDSVVSDSLQILSDLAPLVQKEEECHNTHKDANHVVAHPNTHQK
jgi:hypothetical protein